MYSTEVWFDKSTKSWKMGSGPGSPFGLEDKAPWTSWMFIFGGFTDSPHPQKQETRGLDAIQATSLLSGKILSNHRLDSSDGCMNNVLKRLGWEKGQGQGGREKCRKRRLCRDRKCLRRWKQWDNTLTSYYWCTLVRSYCRGQNQSTAFFYCWPKCAHRGIFDWFLL